MTIEELDILVEASIEPALKEIKRLIPQIKQNVEQAVTVAQKSMGKVDTKSVSNKVQKAVQAVKNKIDNLKKSSESSEVKIKVNNKEASKQLTQLEKEIDSLEKKISSRNMKINIASERMDEIRGQTIKDYRPEGVNPNSGAIQRLVDSKLSSNSEYTKLGSQVDTLISQVKGYQNELETAKGKVKELKEEMNKNGEGHSKWTSFFSGLKEKIGQAKASVSGFKGSFKQLPSVTQNITNNIEKMTTKLKGGLAHVLKYAGALIGLRSIYQTLKSTANAWLSSQDAGAKQLSANIEYMKTAMGSALAPVIQFITNLIYQLLKAIQSLVYAFSGLNIFAKATAKSMNSAAGSAGKASKSLSGIHSDINNVSDGGGGSVSPNMDLSEMDNSMSGWIDKIKEKLTDLFEPIKNSWDKYGQPLMDSIQYAFSSKLSLIKSIGKSFATVWKNGTGEHTVSTILQILTSIFNICGNISTAFKNAWENSGGTEIIQNLWDALNNILDIVLGVHQAFENWTASESFQTFANAIVGICQTLSSWFKKVTDKLKEIWENGGKDTFNKLLNFFSKVVEAIDVVLKALSPVVDFILDIITPVINGIITAIGYVIDALSGVLDFIIGIFTGDWERAWNGIKEFFIGIWNAIKTIVVTVFNFIKDLITKILDAIKSVWSSVWNWIKDVASSIWNGIKNAISNIIDGIKTTISNVLNGIKTIWNNIWNGLKTTVTNIFNGIWNTIKKVINSILGGIEGMANGVVKGINKVIDAMNKLKFDIPDWIPGVGGKTFGFNIPKIKEVSLPRLAKGNVAYEETVGIFGEYMGARNNPEITAPQNIMAETFRNVLSDFDFNNNGGRPMRVQLIVGAKTFVDEVIDGINEKTRQTGKAQIKVAYE